VDLLREGVGHQRGQRGEEGRQEDAHVPDVDGHVQQPHQAVQGRRGEHQARVNGAADDASQGIPGAVIEPVVELVEALLGEEPRGAVVEVRVELMDNALESQHGKQARGERCAMEIGKGSSGRRWQEEDARQWWHLGIY